jgi:excinuclease ABC subunit C
MIRQDFDKLNFPDTPGVYFWLDSPEHRKGGRDSDGKILYIGKATSLRDRVRSYFAPDVIKTRGPHIVDMVFRSNTVKYQETMNALEALILEANLIKKHKPYYNTKEKDDKSFNCVAITKEVFPKVILVRQKDIDTKNKTVKVLRNPKPIPYESVFGPYPKGSSIKEALRILRRIFPFRDIASEKKDNAVFYRQIGLSPDTSSKEAQASYKKTISRLKMIFEGKYQKLLKDLKKEMLVCAKKEQFELANEIKQKVFALEHIQDISLIKRDLSSGHSDNDFRIEAYDVAHISGKQMVGVMTVVTNAIADKNEYRKFVIKGFDKANDAGALKEILTRRFAHSEWAMPSAIVVDGNIIQTNVAQEVLTSLKLKIPIIAVTKDERHRPKAITGPKELVEARKYDILLANSEAHRFAISFHKQRRQRAFK